MYSRKKFIHAVIIHGKKLKPSVIQNQVTFGQKFRIGKNLVIITGNYSITFVFYKSEEIFRLFEFEGRPQVKI